MYSNDLKFNFTFSAYSNDKNPISIDLYIENEYLNLYYFESKKYSKKEYFCKATYEELRNNKTLSLTNNLEQAFNAIKDLINNDIKLKNYPKIIKQTNEIILIIPIKISNFNDLMFKLIEKEKSVKEIIDELIIKDEEKEKQINQILNSINLIEKKLDEKENIIKKLENKIFEIESQI